MRQKFFQYSVTLALNHEEIRKDPQRITKSRAFTKNMAGKEQIFHQKKMIGKNWEKIM